MLVFYVCYFITTATAAATNINAFDLFLTSLTFLELIYARPLDPLTIATGQMPHLSHSRLINVINYSNVLYYSV